MPVYAGQQPLSNSFFPLWYQYLEKRQSASPNLSKYIPATLGNNPVPCCLSCLYYRPHYRALPLCPIQQAKRQNIICFYPFVSPPLNFLIAYIVGKVTEWLMKQPFGQFSLSSLF